MNFRNYAKLIIRVYVIVLIAGFLTGLITELDFRFPSNGLLSISAWPLGGIAFGLLYLGLGPIVVLYLIGIQNGRLIESYLRSGGSILIGEKTINPLSAAGIVEISYTSIASIAFLYGAVGGMYLSIYYLGIFNTGFAQDETLKRNFIRKVAESFLLAIIAFGLKLISL